MIRSHKTGHKDILAVFFLNTISGTTHTYSDRMTLNMCNRTETVMLYRDQMMMFLWLMSSEHIEVAQRTHQDHYYTHVKIINKMVLQMHCFSPVFLSLSNTCIKSQQMM